MKPDVDRLLEVAAVQLMGQVSPALPSSYEQSSAAAMGALLLAVREEFERGARRRVEENRALRELFRTAAPVVGPGPLAERLESAAATQDDDLGITPLEAANGELRGLLVELHARVEELDSPAARDLEDAIWSELVTSTERRKLAFSFF